MEPKLFSSEYNTRADEFKQYLPVNVNLRYETVAPHLALCEDSFILPLLGADLFARMTDYLAGDPLLETECADSALINKVRFALIRLALWKGYDVIAANISDTGVSAEVDKENRLYRYQEENLKRSLKEEGFDALDAILEYIDDNAATFTEYTSPDDILLVNDTATFNAVYNIGGSRLTYLKMRQYVRDVELIQLQHRIGADFYQDLLACDESVSRYAKILPYIRDYVVYMAVAEGIGELHKMPTEKGLLFETASMDGVTVAPVERAQLSETRTQFAHKADQYLAAALNIIQSNADDYGNYTGFAGDSPADGVIRFDNQNRKIFMA